MSIPDNETWSPKIVCDIIRDSKTCIILRQLGKADATLLSTLKRDLRGKKIEGLQDQLKTLVQYHLAESRYPEGYPLRLEYALTALGRSLLSVIDMAEEIGVEIMRELDQSNPLANTQTFYSTVSTCNTGDKRKQEHVSVGKYDELIGLLESRGITYLASVTADGYPRIRAMLQPCRWEGNQFYYHTNTSSPKVAQFRENPKACLYVSDEQTFKGVSLTGQVEVLDDTATKADFWRDGYRMYYPGGPEDPDYCLLRFTAQSGEAYADMQVTAFDF